MCVLIPITREFICEVKFPVICQQLIMVDESNQTSKCSLLKEKLAV